MSELHPLHPDRSPITAAIFKVLAAADCPLTEDQIRDGVDIMLGSQYRANITYILMLLRNSGRLEVITYSNHVRKCISIVDELYSIKNPLDGLANL